MGTYKISDNSVEASIDASSREEAVLDWLNLEENEIVKDELIANGFVVTIEEESRCADYRVDIHLKAELTRR